MVLGYPCDYHLLIGQLIFTHAQNKILTSLGEEQEKS